jgi:demethylmenaquinone methyltransferase/2-methoxy-6-polyprenyl-1,4-benzoquinol methylase
VYSLRPVLPEMMSASDPLRPHPPLQEYYGSEGERRRRIVGWFDESAPDYDWVNRVLSFGSGSRYRRDALLEAGLAAGMSHLDVACGTGVLAAHAQAITGPGGLVVGLDPSAGMLRQAGRRGVRRRTIGVAEALPFPDGRFDVLSMGYALRHVADLRTTFREYRRVLKPGGRVLILEITPPESRLSHKLLAFYMGRVLPLLARFGRGGRTSRVLMEYFWETIETCVPPRVILGALEEAGFQSVERRVRMGILSEYTAVR